LYHKPHIKTPLLRATQAGANPSVRGKRKMIAKMWIALALGATLMVGGAVAVSALPNGNFNGECAGDCLRDGSCGDCTCDTLGEDASEDELTEDCDSCNEYLYDYLYGEPGPHQSASGQE